VLDPIWANVHVERLRQVHRILCKAYRLDVDRAPRPPAPGPRPDNVVELPAPAAQG
jgi:hypothetical protein